MYTEHEAPPVLRFEVAVSADNYRLLVAHLRGGNGNPVPSSRSNRDVRARIDLHPTSKSFTVTRLGQHKLPRPLVIRRGSQTYQSLTRAISSEVQRSSPHIDPRLADYLQGIIELCPEITTEPLRVDPKDLELHTQSDHAHQLQETSALAPILATLAPTLLLDLDDTPTLVVENTKTPNVPELEARIANRLQGSTPLTTVVSGNTVEFHQSVLLPALPEECSITLNLHWGGYEDLSPAWLDEPLTTVQGTPAAQQIALYHRSHVTIHGLYGATIYAQVQGSSERIWFGPPQKRDAVFYIAHDDPTVSEQHATTFQNSADEASTLIAEAISNPGQFEDVSAWFTSHASQLSVGALLAENLSATQSEEEALTTFIERLSATEPAEVINRIRSSYGLGEIVFATPEGPHAAAGGLAQVISGLPLELAGYGIPISIITPLFRYPNGNKHPSADHVLTEGIRIGSRRVIPCYVATVAVHLGPTHYPNTSNTKRPPSTVMCKVYLAQSGNIRIFLLAHSGVFDRLYQPVPHDEQLRRAIVFSRAVLETVGNQKLGIRPSVIISNDWMTACIPALKALDPRYQTIQWLQSCKTVHMIHNGGADYHGRLPLHFSNEDLWPLFNLAPEHYFGFKDPHTSELINLTMAASRHVTGGVITVSQPYARQLTEPYGGGDGLGYVLHAKRDAVYGVSNGINRVDIDSYLSLRSGYSTNELSDVKTLLQAKIRIKQDLQARYGLVVNPDATLLSFVGRIAEQKGLHLLSGFVAHAPHSTLEDLLVRHPDLQILIAGPVTTGDSSASALCNALHYLSQKYPGRVCALYDYISHSTALEIIAGSTFFLMPSRFEPGGITQLEALAVGTPIVGRAVGGIAATITNFDLTTETGSGFLCEEYSPTAFANTAHWAIATCTNRSLYESVVSAAREAEHSWKDRAPIFAAVLQRIVLGDARMRGLNLLTHPRALAEAASAN